MGLLQRKAYRFPFCKGNVRSDVRTGRIDHRTVCGNQFYVKDSAVSKNRRCHARSCAVCSTVIWSSQSCGRIAVTHVTPSGKRCQMKHWHVPDKKAKEKRKWNRRRRRCACRRNRWQWQDPCGEALTTEEIERRCACRRNRWQWQDPCSKAFERFESWQTERMYTR